MLEGRRWSGSAQGERDTQRCWRARCARGILFGRMLRFLLIAAVFLKFLVQLLNFGFSVFLENKNKGASLSSRARGLFT